MVTAATNIQRVLSAGKGPLFRYAGIMLLAACAFMPQRAGADTTATVYMTKWPEFVGLAVYGNLGTVYLLEHNGGSVWSAERERLEEAYTDTIVTANPYLSVRPGINPRTAWQSDMLPFIRGIENADSAVLTFRIDPGDTVPGLQLYYLDGTVWTPHAFVRHADTVSARITADGFYAVLVRTGASFGFEEYLSSYPNPFRPPWEEAKITYLLAADAEVEIRICTRTGGLVRTLSFGAGQPGGRGSGSGFYLNRVLWDGRNEQGRLVEPGGYYCRLVVRGQYSLDWKIGVQR